MLEFILNDEKSSNLNINDLNYQNENPLFYAVQHDVPNNLYINFQNPKQFIDHYKTQTVFGILKGESTSQILTYK